MSAIRSRSQRRHDALSVLGILFAAACTAMLLIAFSAPTWAWVGFSVMVIEIRTLGIHPAKR